ncbi:SET and MYND domain-containing protein 4-like [Bradysia coprophila]|uniref:SET and MYND domain-containing protein 4-like n=1 Tax=Bradysia coprophila TaxID=38358 RepID=UPI00187D90A3|nr:SET and MYND domain-containing protein 4-like [Bradysia coprophila]
MELLWQKEPSKDNTDLYVDIFRNVPPEFRKSCLQNISKYKAERNSVAQKSDEKSSMFYSNGNRAFETSDWREAMKCYNASLCFAEINSKNTSFVYASRSVCFFQLKMYRKCLVDIDLAEQANYPVHLLPTLHEQRRRCLERMKSDDERGEFVPILSYGDDENFPGMANVLRLQFTENFGRHIIAKTDISVGKTILVEEPFTSRLVGIQHINCAACLKTTMNFIACEHCTGALFCDSTCADNYYHKIECAEHWFDSKSPNEFYMRSIITALNIFDNNAERLQEFVEDAINENVNTAPESLNDLKSKYRALLQLNTFTSDKNRKLHYRPAYMIFYSLMTLESIKKIFDTKPKRRFLMHLALHHYVVISINNFRNVDCDAIEDEGAFIICSYFNHACAPNLMVKRTGQYRYCVTVRPIKAGQQLFVTYFGDLFCEQPVEHCQEYLLANFNFRCTCERCKPHILKMNSEHLLSDPEYSYLCTEQFKQPAQGYDIQKLIHLQGKFVDLLNRFGEHWSRELDTVIEGFDSISDQIVLTKQSIPLGLESSSNYEYVPLIILVISIVIYVFSFK